MFLNQKATYGEFPNMGNRTSIRTAPIDFTFPFLAHSFLQLLPFWQLETFSAFSITLLMPQSIKSSIALYRHPPFKPVLNGNRSLIFFISLLAIT